MKVTYQKPIIQVVEVYSPDIIRTSSSTLNLYNGFDDTDSDADYDYEAL